MEVILDPSIDRALPDRTRSSPLIALLMLGLLAACSRAPVPADSPPPPAPSTEASTQSNADEGAYRIYVTNEMSGDLSVIDGTAHQVVSTLPLGKRPRGIRTSPDGTRLYVALSGSPIAPPGVDESTLPPADKSADGIGVVDVKTLSLQTILRGFSDPEQLALARDGAHMYIASEDTGTLVIADARSGSVAATLPVGGEPEGVTLSSDGKFVYVTSEEDHKISVVDTGTHKLVTAFEVGLRPRDITFSTDGKRAYISNENDASITFVDAQSHRPERALKLPGTNVRPMGLALSPDNRTLYVATGRGKTIIAVDTTTLETRTSAPIGERPWGIALSPDGRLLYSANGPSNDVSIIDAASLALLGKVNVGQRPWGLVVIPHAR